MVRGEHYYYGGAISEAFPQHKLEASSSFFLSQHETRGLVGGVKVCLSVRLCGVSSSADVVCELA